LAESAEAIAGQDRRTGGIPAIERQNMKHLTGAAALALLWCGPAAAGVIEQACLSSDRQGVDRALCSCIQYAADITLSPSDQRRAAKFFSNPQKTQDIRQNSDAGPNDFWTKYVNFGATAEAFCSASG
jgi:hypothetical protein